MFKPDQDSEPPIIAGDTSMTNTPRTLGNSTLQVGRIGLGCMGMSEFYSGTRDEAGHIKTLHAAIDLGINFFDTADMYGVGHNEELISKAFSDRWDKVTVATKFGVQRGANGEWLGLCGRPEYVKEACEKSLKRLGLETIDLYYQHRPDPNVPVEESVGAMKELVEEGKVRFIGLSEFSPEQIRAAHAVHPITALQRRGSCRPAVTWASPSSPMRRWAVASSPARFPTGRRSTQMTGGATIRASATKRWRRTLALWS
jgi:aryl-alcohol dehydrogenase-like predicted oxidoreductase